MKYDAKGNLIDRIALRNGVGALITDPAGYTPLAADIVARTISTYDQYGNVLTSKAVRDASSSVGPTITYEYADSLNPNPTKITRAGDKDGDGVIGAGEFDTATLTYDSFKRLYQGITGDWHQTTFTYDSVDRVVTFKDGLGKTRTWSYDANGNRAFETLPNVDQWSAGFDLSDRKVSTQNAAGFATTTKYDAAGNVLAVTNPDGFTLKFDYDPMNRVVRAVDQEGLSVTRTLDLAGKPRTVTDPNGNTTSFSYYGPEKHGRVQAKTDPPAAAGGPGLQTQYDYDANGNAIRMAVVAPNGGGTQETLTWYDELNRATRVVGPVFTDVATSTQKRPVTCFTYTLLGFRTEVRAGGTTDLTGATPACNTLGVQMTYVYDDFGRKLKEIDPLGRTWATTYDVNDNPLTVTDPRQQQQTNQQTTLTWGYGHQLLTRTATIMQAGTQVTQVTQWTRNDLGQVTQVYHPSAQTLLYTYTYDVAHRPATFTDARGAKTLTYNYSAGGLLNYFQDTDGNRTDYVYDYSGRLAEVWAPNGDIVGFAYDAGGRLRDKWLPNGVKTKYTYNGDNTLASVTNLHSANTISSHVYAYDGFRNRTRHDETIGVNATTTPYLYQYDNLNRLTAVKNNTTGATLEAYAFDVVGNRTSKTDGAGNVTAYVYDSGNQLTEAHQTSPSGTLTMGLVYDANGNLVKKCEGGTVTTSSSTCSGTTITDLTYDALNRMTQAAKTQLTTQTYMYDDQGRRIQKAIGTNVTNYLYNGDNAHATYGSVWDTPSAKYTYGPGIDTPILKTVGSATQYFHQDGLGSVVALTNQSGGTDATTRYDAWGNVLGSTGTQSIYGYTGREPDETGLIYYRARYYDPTTGRFTQRDPVGFAGGMNAYLYADGNPVNATDPTGTTPAPVSNTATSDQSYFSGGSGAPTLSPGSQQTPPGSGRLVRVDIDPSGQITTSDVTSVTTPILAIHGVWNATLTDAVDATTPKVLQFAGATTSYTLFFHPSRGVLSDLFDTLLDKLGISTPMAKQFAEILLDVQASGNATTVLAHSQGGAITSQAVNIINGGGEGRLSPNIDIGCNGCASNSAVSGQIYARAGITSVKNNPGRFDIITNVIGMNWFPDPTRILTSLLGAPLLFGPDRFNPHVAPYRR